MNVEFNLQFKVGKTFSDREELKKVVTTFGKTFNVKDSHPKRGSFSYTCKHDEIKRDINQKDKDVDTESTENDLKR